MVFTVFEVNSHLKQVIENSIDELYVRGEVSNFTHHISGHMYFNLKDENASLRCTFFRYANSSLKFSLENGMQVVCLGKLTLYEKGGTYNLNVINVTLAGKGDLALQFERLKAKLAAEGLFDPGHKRALPKFPNKIGIVTSPTGAALQDIKNIIVRRFPVEVIVYPALVQGPSAAATVIQGIQYFDSRDDIELVIITRGGGSQEDLWCFNDEALARCIYQSRHPLISAVGHEIDFTIADFVADLRAPTPSAAAELAVPDKNELLKLLKLSSERMYSLMQAALDRSLAKYSDARFHLQRVHPERKLQSMQQRVDYAYTSLQRSQEFFTNQEHLLQAFQKDMKHHGQFLKEMIQQKQTYLKRTLQPQFEMEFRHYLENLKQNLQQKMELLKLQSPLKMMDRGFAYVSKADKPIDSVNQIELEDELQIQFQDGKVSSTVHHIHKDKSS